MVNFLTVEDSLQLAAGFFNDVTYKINGAVILELKAVEQIQKVHDAQLLNYLKATGIRIGLIVNFRHPKAEIKRMVLDLPKGTTPIVATSRRHNSLCMSV